MRSGGWASEPGMRGWGVGESGPGMCALGVGVTGMCGRVGGASSWASEPGMCGCVRARGDMGQWVHGGRGQNHPQQWLELHFAHAMPAACSERKKAENAGVKAKEKEERERQVRQG